jgi:hypothetical protein
MPRDDAQAAFAEIAPARQLLLGHRKVESTVRYPGIEVDDALEISEAFDL